MPILFFFKGLAISLIFGIPAGAVGALTIRRSLPNGFFAGFCTGLGSSVADIIYASAGIFGMSFVSGFILRYEKIITLCGGAFLFVMAAFILNITRQNSQETQENGNANLFVNFYSAFLVALTNPATFLSFISAFAIFRIDAVETPFGGVLLLAGILCGSLAWWTALSAICSAFKPRITRRIFIVLNYMLAGILILLGIIAVVRGVRGI